jgi:hypothetical protein
MKKFFTVFFVVLGVVFFALLIVLAYLFVVDPYNLKPMLLGTPVNIEVESVDTSSISVSEDGVPVSAATNTNLSPAQEAALESVGIAPAVVPTFTAAQLQCFEGLFGKARVEEIKAGATPSATEFYKAKACL